LRRLTLGFCLAVPLGGALCTGLLSEAKGQAPMPKAPVQTPERLVAPREVVSHSLSLTLDEVLRLADQQNPRIAVAREKVNETLVELDRVNHCPLSGRLRKMSAEAQVWRQKAELSQTEHDILLEAGTTFIDLLMARRGEALSRDLDEYERQVQERAGTLDKQERIPHGVLESVRAARGDREHTTARLRQQTTAATEKLTYLLNLAPRTVVILPPAVTPTELVDVTVPIEDLVAQAISNGPTVHELEALIGVIQSGLDGAHQLGDLIHRIRSEKERAQSKQKQAQLTLEDTRAKLGAGVREARSAILHSREQAGFAAAQIKDASTSYRENNKRLQEGLPGASVGETMLAIRSLELANFNHLNSIRNHNKAQLRLLLLLGSGPHRHAVESIPHGAIPHTTGHFEAK
jgi:outer membrane protein TolC